MNVSLVGFTTRIRFSIPPPRHLDSLTRRTTARSADETLARIRRRLVWVLTVGAATLLANAMAIALGWYAVL